MTQDEFGGGQVAAAGPVELGVQTLARSSHEIVLGGSEAHPRPQGPVLLREHPQGSVVERRIRQGVDDRRTGRQDPVFDPNMRSPLDNVVDRAVPAVDSPVVQPHLGERGDAAGFEQGRGVLVDLLRQQRREVADVLLEQVEDRGCRPPG